MKIKQLILENFRGYKSLRINLDESFNLIIGDNGSGKTALLEALTVAMGSFFLGIRDVYSRGIYKKDIHIATYDDVEEYIFPVKIKVNGIVNEKELFWSRELSGNNNRTTSIKAEKIKEEAQFIDNLVRKGEKVNLPLLTYYATGRLFDKARDVDEKENDKKRTIASRFRAYDRCLDAKSTHKQFQKWFRSKELSRIQKGHTDISLEVVKSAIVKNLPNCKNFFYEFDPDKPQGLKIELTDGRILPFLALSDGTRNFFAIISDIAYKCVTLNPHLKTESLINTTGIVLIDELDLHLHPEWQRKIISALRDTFPNIQFIATTHSPFLIQETGRKQLIILKNSSIENISSGSNLSIEDIAEELQYVNNPQWSKLRKNMFEIAGKYYKAVKEGTDTPEMKVELDKAMKPFAIDTAYYSIIEQERIIQKYKQDKK